MHAHHLIVASAIASLLVPGPALAAEKNPMEKCYGITKAGMNDCQTSASACAGAATEDRQRDAWIVLPKGACEKIVGGSLNSGK